MVTTLPLILRLLLRLLGISCCRLLSVVEAWTHNQIWQRSVTFSVSSHLFRRQQLPKNKNNRRKPAFTTLSSSNSESGEDDSLPNEEDWRVFRAKLVLNEAREAAAATAAAAISDYNDASTIGEQDPLGESWIYNAGLNIEKGSIVVSRVESRLGCHDLRQPYFAKCVILILEHEEEDNDRGEDDNDEGSFTQGIILNRPSNLVLSDQDILYLDDDGNPIIQRDDDDEDGNNQPPASVASSSSSWNMCFGGDIAGLYDDDPLILCLHNLTDSEAAPSVSDTILPGIQLTSHLAARALVENSLEQAESKGDGSINPESIEESEDTAVITPESFFTFSGFCGWDAGQLQREVERGSWDIVSVDSQTLWNELQLLREPPNNDPRNVGLTMWERFRRELDGDCTSVANNENTVKLATARDTAEFATSMLKEWATEALYVANPTQRSDDTNDEDGFVNTESSRDNPSNEDEENSVATYLQDADIYRALSVASKPPSITAGTVLCANEKKAFPFLLQEQYLHKSIILVLQESSAFSVGVVLNLPTTKVFEMNVMNGAQQQTINFPIRYGGPSSGSENESPKFLWFHNNALLKEVNLGKPLHPGPTLGNAETTVWTCTQDQVEEAIAAKLVPPSEFVLVEGFCVWEKAGGADVTSNDEKPQVEENAAGGVLGQVFAGNLQVLSEPDDDDDDDGDDAGSRIDRVWSELSKQTRLSTESIEFNFDQILLAWEQSTYSRSSSSKNQEVTYDTPRCVFDSTVLLSDLANDALKAWIQIYLIDQSKFYV